MLSGDREDTENLRKSFPLFQVGEYDFFYKNAPWQIGLESTCPAELKRKITGAFISEVLQLKSVDNVIRKYLKDRDHEEADYDRLDLRIRRHITSSMVVFRDGVEALSKSAPQTLNCAVSGWTLIRAPFSIEQMAYCAHRGALFEANAIARIMLEQLAWASYAFSESDSNNIFRRKPQSCMSLLKTDLWYAGYLYGWMSNHAHWSFEAHRKSAISRKGQFGHLFSSTYFKALSFALMIVMVDAYIKVLTSMIAKNGPFSSFLWNIERVESAVLDCRNLIIEITDCCKDDEDLADLSAMVNVESEN